MIIDMTTKTVRFIILFLSAFFATVGAYAQNIPVVHGKIVDENGEPLPAATVVVKGTTKIAIADLQGAFELQDVPLSSVLEVAFLGCETKEVAPTSRKMEIVLSAAKDILDDAVVIGYGTARKRDLTGSVVSLRGDELIEKTPVDVYDILQGQVAGVQINSNSGAPGEGATVRIRGIATFGEGANPLYVVDDLPVDNIDSVNPEDISSIEVLKDAASAAIYGSRSANGVILITTKKGVPGKPKVDVRYSHAFNNVSHLMPLTTPDDFRYYEDVRYGLTGISNFWREDENRPFYNYDGNLYRDILRTAHKDEVNLSASGASDRLQYFLSGGYYGEQGVIINSDYKRVTARMNVSYKANENFTFGSNAQFQFSDRMGCNENNIISDIYQWVPYWNIKLADGSPMPSIAGKTSAYIRCLDQREEQKKINASGMIFAEFRFAEFFKIRANLSGSMDLLRINYFQPTTLVNSSTGHSKGFDKTKLTYFWLNEDYISYEDYVTDAQELYDEEFLFNNPEVCGSFFREGQKLNFIITRSAHLSYKYNEVLSAWGLRKYPQYKGMTGNEEEDCMYLKARLVDDMFARLLGELEDHGELENTVIVAYTDHYSYGFQNEQLMMERSGVDDQLLLEKTPCFIWSSDGLRIQVKKTLNTADLLPTVLNLLGVNSPYHYIGQDAFDENYVGYALFPNGSWVCDGVAYSAASGRTILLEEGKGVTPEQMEQMAQTVNAFVYINNLILETDYYAAK